MRKRKAWLSGITGQDGSYLAEFLLSKDYEVYGLLRRTSTPNCQRISHILNDLCLIHGDLSDMVSISRSIASIRPDEIYNLGALSHVGRSFEEPLVMQDVTGLGAVRIFEACRLHAPKAKIFQASSSEMFGVQYPSVYREDSPLFPVSPYGCAKAFAHSMAKTYRKSYGLFVACGISFNHESERRGEEFVTRKITRTLSRIKLGLEKKLVLGNTKPLRDFSYAPEVVEMFWRMLQLKSPEDFVIASGKSHRIKEFLDAACLELCLEAEKYVEQSDELKRPSEINELRGLPGKAEEILGWHPKVDFHEIVRRMVRHDLKLAQTEHSDSKRTWRRPKTQGAPLVSKEADAACG